MGRSFDISICTSVAEPHLTGFISVHRPARQNLGLPIQVSYLSLPIQVCLSSLRDYGKNIAILELVLQTYRLARELGTLPPDQSIAEEIHEVTMEMLTYRLNGASIQEH